MALVTVWGQDGQKILEDAEYDYVSFVNSDTHGIPALLSGRANPTVEAAAGDAILYVNTDLIPLVEVEK